MPAQSQNAANLDAGLMRFEPFPPGESQVQPEFPYRQPEFLAPIEESHFEPAVTVLSMSLQWERLLANEKRRNRQLTFWLVSAQDQLQQVETNYKVLRQQYERLCNGNDGNSQPGWGLQDAQKTPTIPNGPQFSNGSSDPSTTNKPSSSPGSMPPPPPPPPPKEDTPQGTKRKGEITGGTNKRVATRNLVLSSYDRPISPKSLFSPQTPTAINFGS